MVVTNFTAMRAMEPRRYHPISLVKNRKGACHCGASLTGWQFWLVDLPEKLP
jgi:hypothetical protein